MNICLRQYVSAYAQLETYPTDDYNSTAASANNFSLTSLWYFSVAANSSVSDTVAMSRWKPSSGLLWLVRLGMYRRCRHVSYVSPWGYWAAYEVCVSLDPENIITSAGEVFVIILLSRAESPMEAFLKNPIAVCATPPRSPFPYAVNALKRSWAASLARFGSFSTPYYRL